MKGLGGFLKDNMQSNRLRDEKLCCKEYLCNVHLLALRYIKHTAALRIRCASQLLYLKLSDMRCECVNPKNVDFTATPRDWHSFVEG